MSGEFDSFPDAPSGQSSATGEFDSFPDVDTGKQKLAPFPEQAGAAAEAGGRAALETSGFVSGAMLGAGAGAPLGPAGALVGGVVGGVGGYLAGEMAGESLGLRAPEQMDPSVRPGGYFGQSLGGAVPVMGAPYAAAVSGYRFGESMVGRFLNQIVNTAKTRPVAFGVTEATGAVSGAGGAGTSEIVAPGRADIRVNAEIAAAVINPTRLTISAYGVAKGVATKAMQSISPAARETAAAKTLSDILAVTGEDPTAIARILRQQGVLEKDALTAAQKSGSMALGAVESYLSKVNQQFGAESAEKARNGLDVIRGQIILLTGTGDPQALAAAAQLRGLYVRTVLSGKVDMAKAEALRTAGNISKNTTADRERLSMAARDALDKSITESRAVEKELWGKVDGTRPVQTTALETTFDDIAGEMLPELRNEKLPSVVRKFLDRVSTPAESKFEYDPDTFAVREFEQSAPGTTVNEMKQLRGELLDLSRQSTNTGDFGQARIYSQLAEAVLDDMDSAFKNAADTAYNEARTFTREFNDVFSRSFAGKVTAQGKYGDRVAPEILLRKALATGKEVGALQLQELEEATRFLPAKGFSDDSAYRTMLDAQERIFRLAAADSLDPVTGRASPERIAKFVKDNPTLLKRFPEVKADLMAAVKSEARIGALENRAKGVETLMSKQGAFASLLGASGNDPSVRANVALKAAERVLVSGDQETDLIKLINTAKGGGTGKGGRIVIRPEEAVDGLRASLFNTILNKSRNTRDGVLNIDQVKNYLFTPTSVGKKSLVQVMQEQGVLKPEEVTGIRKLFEAASNIQRSQKPGTAVDVKGNVLDVAMATLSRMIGSGAAGGAARAVGSSSPSLIVHGAGARLAEEAMTKLPVQSVNKVLTEAMLDPEKMALLLNKADTPEKAAFQARQIHAWFVQSALTGVATTVDRQFERPAEPQPMFSAPR